MFDIYMFSEIKVGKLIIVACESYPILVLYILKTTGATAPPAPLVLTALYIQVRKPKKRIPCKLAVELHVAIRLCSSYCMCCIFRVELHRLWPQQIMAI